MSSQPSNMNTPSTMNSIPASSGIPANSQVHVDLQGLPYGGVTTTQASMVSRRGILQQQATLNPKHGLSARVFNWNAYRHAQKGKMLPVFSPQRPPFRALSRITSMAVARLYSNPHTAVRRLNASIVSSKTITTSIYAHAGRTHSKALPMQRLSTLLTTQTYQNTHAQRGGATSHVTSTPHRLVTLPAEVRLEIYHHLFSGARFEASRFNMDRCSVDDQFSPYRLTMDVDTGILSTSKFFLNEALPYLNAATTIEVPHSFGRNDPLANLPDEFLSRIKNIKVNFDSFVHIDRRRLPSLQNVHLFHDVDAPSGFSEVVEMINDGGMEDVIEESFDDVLSWKWKQRQFAYLAAEEGFALKMVVSWSFWCPVPEMAGIELEMDAATNTVFRTRGFIGSQEVAVDNIGQAKKDWEAFSGM